MVTQNKRGNPNRAYLGCLDVSKSEMQLTRAKEPLHVLGIRKQNLHAVVCQIIVARQGTVCSAQWCYFYHSLLFAIRQNIHLNIYLTDGC